MRLALGLAAARSRNAWIGCVLAMLVSGLALTLSAAMPTAPAATQQAAAPPTRVYNLGAAMILHNIKPDKTADFEMVMGKVKEALQKSEDPIRKQQAASWKLYKAAEPGPNGAVLYVFFLDPAVKDSDYTIAKILTEGFPTEVQALYKTFSDCYAGGQTHINLQPLADMSK